MRTLIDVINYPRSVVELYLSKDGKEIIEVKCLPENTVKEYTYKVDDYSAKAAVLPARTRSRLMSALSV